MTLRLLSSCILALSIALTGCVEDGLAPRAPTPGVPHVTITSFNVDLKRANDPATVAAVVAADADIICLQEANRAWADVLRATYADRYPYMAFHGEGSGGLAILSRYPFQDLGVVPGFEDWHPAWHVLVDSPLGPLQILQVHLRPPVSKRGGYVASYLTIDSVHDEEIRRFSAQCDGAVPTVVLGDFNEDPDGTAVRYLEKRGFRNLLPLFQPGQETWRYGKSVGGQMVDTLDHILVNDSLDPLNAYVLYEGRSDHLPVTAVLQRK